jgi:FixJ family two-component response regulator
MEAPGWIAIIDDDPSVLKALTRSLQLRAFQTRTYESAREFLSVIPAGLPMCMILDLQMPEMTGLELLQHLERQDIHIPAIVITAHTDATALEHCESAGAIAILPKPWRNDLLFAAIDNAQRRNRIRGLS